MLNVENVLVMSLCVSYVRFYVLFVFRNIETVCSTTSEMDCAETWFALVSLKTCPPHVIQRGTEVIGDYNLILSQ